MWSGLPPPHHLLRADPTHPTHVSPFQQESQEWQTAAQNVYQKPTARAGDLRAYSDVNKVGARTAAMLAALHKESEVAPPVEGIAPTTESTARVRPAHTGARHVIHHSVYQCLPRRPSHSAPVLATSSIDST